MLETTASQLAEADLPENHRKWALLESFLIHARSLRHVFYECDRRHKDDVFASDYFPRANAWRDICGPMPAALQPIKEVHKEIAHLTYARLEPDRPGKWEVPSIHSALSACVLKFPANVQPRLLSDQWHGRIPDPRRALPGMLTGRGTVTTCNTIAPPPAR